ncbi:MAG TPA: hypothetical protein VHM70_09505 [Polyangiaceae bacterium]|jgi:hypothetical protein|nr:hypothetical protein [Polyangiaceae bacterium]
MDRAPTELYAAPYTGSSEVATIVRELKAALPNPEQYEIQDESEYGAHLVSKHCVIVISKDRYGDAFGIYVRQPGENRDDMDLYLLRQLRGAYHPSRKGEDVTYYGHLLAEFFPDLLAGDFSIQTRYRQVEKEFNRLIFELRRLPAEHPAVQLCRRYDIRWMKKLGLFGRFFG